MDMLGDELTVEAPAPEAIAPGERLGGHRVAGRSRREQLVDGPHAARRATAVARRPLTASQLYRSST